MRAPRLPTPWLLATLVPLTFALAACGDDEPGKDGETPDDTNASSSSSSGGAGGSSSGQTGSSSGGGSSSGQTGSSSGTSDPLYAAAQAVAEDYCTSCHSGAGASAGLDLGDLRNAVGKASRLVDGRTVVVAGNSADSLLVELLSGRVGGVARMPTNARLSEAEIQAIKDWVDAGAE